jgi:hypothetical protein
MMKEVANGRKVSTELSNGWFYRSRSFKRERIVPEALRKTDGLARGITDQKAGRHKANKMLPSRVKATRGGNTVLRIELDVSQPISTMSGQGIALMNECGSSRLILIRQGVIRIRDVYLCKFVSSLSINTI